MTAGDFESQMRVYAALMVEVKARIACTYQCVSGETKLESWADTELSYLQLRKMCELIALGCLVAHGDIKEIQTPHFQKQWEPPKILKGLHRLRSDFYPTPVSVSINDGRIEMREIGGGFLTRPELLRLHGRCGEKLHRGSLRSVLDAKKRGSADIPPSEAAQKMTRLLDGHYIRSKGSKRLIVCRMNDEKGDVQVISTEQRSPL
jgi:hypothetical protein